MTSEALFVEAWKAGVELDTDGERLLLNAPSKPSQDLLDKLAEHKDDMLRFLGTWIDTPLGQAKFAFFLGEFRCGVVLRKQPDKFTFIQRSKLGLKEDANDLESVKH